MKTLVINLPRCWKTIGLALLGISLIVTGGYYFYLKACLIPPVDLINKALDQAYEASSYRYTMVSQFITEGQPQIWSDVTGEKANHHDLHLSGTMLNTPIEMYQVGDTSYNRDPFTNRWYAVQGYDLTRQELLMTEVNPLANFNFKEIFEARYNGQEEVRHWDCWVVECTADLENQLLEVLWQDFQFKFWIDQRGHFLARGQLTAHSKSNPESILTITAEFYDYNQPIQLAVPQV
ncbi:MAG: hypothetical protein ACOX5W_08750 [Bacillota bacterium]|jgi:hypothetical protein